MDKIPTERIGEALDRAAACNAKANILLGNMTAHIRATEGASAEPRYVSLIDWKKQLKTRDEMMEIFDYGESQDEENDL